MNPVLPCQLEFDLCRNGVFGGLFLYIFYKKMIRLRPCLCKIGQIWCFWHLTQTPFCVKLISEARKNHSGTFAGRHFSKHFFEIAK
jgi:hypothetical protein